MNGVRIQTGDTEIIWFLALDASKQPVTGKTDLLISIFRASDGFYLDFNDQVFKSTGWVARQTPMTEKSASLAAGEYFYNFDTSAISNPTTDDQYQARVDQSPGTDVVNVPATGEIKVGDWVDDIDTNISSRSSHAPNNVRDVILSDSTAFPGANIDAAISSRSSQTAVDVAVLLAAAHGAGSWETLDDTAILAAIAALNDIDIADVQTALDNQGLTTIRAALLDNLDAAISSVLVAIAALNDIDQADVQVAMMNQGYTNVRAALLNNLDAAVSGIPAAVQALLDAAHGAGSWESADLTTLETKIEFLYQIQGGRWLIDENNDQMVFYEDDNTTEIARFNLFDVNGTPAYINVFERRRV
jgi:hypothetical protein